MIYLSLESTTAFDIVFLVSEQGVHGAVNCVIFAVPDLDRDNGKTVVIVNQIIRLALAAIIVIKKFMTVGNQLRGYNCFIDGTEIAAFLFSIFEGSKS